jgi:GMP reductase
MPRIEDDVKLDFKDVLIRPKRSTLKSRSQVNLERTYKFKHSGVEWTGTPIMAANMDTVGTFEIAIAFAEQKLFTCIHKHYSIDEWVDFAAKHADVLPYIAASSGTSDADFNKLKAIFAKVSVNFICLDVANGYSEHFVDHVKRTREAFPKATLIAGNVVTGEMTEQLILSGADIVKIGIGPGSVCTTRKQTGVGYPQLSAVMECADAAHGLGGHVISDGGCTCPGDFSKAFGGGADFVMAGGMFASHYESGGELIEVDGKLFKQFYGMSSSVAMNKHSGGVAEYRSSEGKCVTLPYKGYIRDTVNDILGGVRSSCTYVGASTLRELPKRTTFIRVTQQINNVFGTTDESKSAPKTAPAGSPVTKKAKTVEN